MSNIFYCYSKRLFHFIKAFNINYLYIGINKNSRQKFYAFEKSEKLDRIIEFYNRVKHSFEGVKKNDDIMTEK